MIQLITLTPTDHNFINQSAHLLHRVFSPRGSWAKLEEAEEEVQEMLAPDRFVRLAVRDGEMIGWIGGIPTYHGNVWELHPLLVKPEEQHQGIGTLLIRDFEQQVKQRGGLTIQLGTDDDFNATSLSNVDLYTNTWEQIRNIRNLKQHPFEFYQKMGYTIVGVVPDANGRGKPDIIMGKRVV